jgi:hypothetical protein
MMRNWLVCFALALAVLLAGCDQQTLIKKFVPQEESAVAQRYLEDVRTGRFSEILKRVAPQDRAEFAKVFPALRAAVPHEQPKSVKVVGSRTSHRPDSVVYALTYEYEYSRVWLIEQIILQRDGRDLKVTGMHFTPLADSIEHINRFTLAGKGALHFGFLFAAVSILLFIVWTAVVCWRTRIPKRKWLWMIFVLLGFGSLTLNWTSGEVVYQLIAVVLLGVGYRQEVYGPVLLQIGFPVGAILFWLRRGKWLSPDAISQSEPD